MMIRLVVNSQKVNFIAGNKQKASLRCSSFVEPWMMNLGNLYELNTSTYALMLPIDRSSQIGH